MTLGKGHLMATLPLFAAAVAYNVWYFSSGGDPVVTRASEPERVSVEVSGPSVTGEAQAAIDPSTIPAPPDVALDRPPTWTRNPFTTARQPAPVEPAVVEIATPVAEPEQEIVVSAIFVSGDRRRARVNGENVTVGDRIGPSAVVDIQPDVVIVESPATGRRVITPQRRGRGAP
jgi:hypothetical protein